MALQGSGTTYFGDNHYRLLLEWNATQGDDGYKNNYSTVTARLYIQCLGGWSIVANATKYGNVNIAGNNLSFSAVLGTINSGNTPRLLCTHTATVYHQNDGTKYLSVGANFNPDVTITGVGYVGNVGVSTGDYLNTIPRKSTASLGNFVVGNAVPVSISRASESFTHTLQLFVNGTQIGPNVTGVANQYVFGASLAAQMYSAMSATPTATAYVTCTTFLNGTQIDVPTNSAQVSATIANNTGTCPLFEDFSYSDTNPLTVALTGNSAVFVKGESTATITINDMSTVQAQKSATMSNFICTLGDYSTQIPYESSKALTVSKSFIDGVDLAVAAVDSRSLKTKISKQAQQVKYQKPAFVAVEVSRENRVDTQTKLTLDATFFDGDFGTATNAITAKYQFRPSGGTWPSDYIPLDTAVITDGKLHFDGLIAGDEPNPLDGFGINDSYDIKVVLEDKLHNMANANEIVQIVHLSRGIPTMHLTQGGVGVGKVWEQGSIDAAGDIYQGGKRILDLVYPVGAIFMSVNGANPQTWLGGTWVAWGMGRTVMGVGWNEANTYDGDGTCPAGGYKHGTAELRGGEYQHKITADEMPIHHHCLYSHPDGPTPIPLWSAKDNGNTGGTPVTTYASNTTDSGGDLFHNNMQPYITCFMWKRTA